MEEVELLGDGLRGEPKACAAPQDVCHGAAKVIGEQQRGAPVGRGTGAVHVDDALAAAAQGDEQHTVAVELGQARLGDEVAAESQVARSAGAPADAHSRVLCGVAHAAAAGTDAVGRGEGGSGSGTGRAAVGGGGGAEPGAASAGGDVPLQSFTDPLGSLSSPTAMEMRLEPLQRRAIEVLAVQPRSAPALEGEQAAPP